MVPDLQALRNLLSLWRRWLDGRLGRGETPWRDVFAVLKNLRTWGPEDRVRGEEFDILIEEIIGRGEDEPIKLEMELVFRAGEQVADGREQEARAAIVAQGGRIVARTRFADIGYHALLVELPVRAVREIARRSPDGVASFNSVMHIRPQSAASGIEVEDPIECTTAGEFKAQGEPVLALLDGVPVAAHPLLSPHVVVDDQFALEPKTNVADRVHGTAMASLVIHGDRNLPHSPLPRRIHLVPVLGPREQFPDYRLIVDVIYAAVVAMRDGGEPTAPGVVIVNLSLGNRRRRFHGQLSAWARLLDRLAYRYGLLFIVSAGNCTETFAIRGFANWTELEDAPADRRARETLLALGEVVGERRLFSPAETVNGLTVGASNEDKVSNADRATARVNVDPYGDLRMANPSSALGPGFALSVKPDVLLSGAREHLRFIRMDSHVEVQPAGAARSAGLRVASPPRGGIENAEGFTNGTSAAAALASRICHRIHDALEEAYGNDFLGLPHLQRAVLLKALLAHTARWPHASAALIRSTIGPAGGHHSHQKDNIRRFLGFGVVDPDDAVACASDRATFWVTGQLAHDKIASIAAPVPAAIGGQARPHELSATLAWFTPTAPGRKSYRSVRLKLLDPAELEVLGVEPHGVQPDVNQTKRGTVFSRCWRGTRAPVVGQNMSIQLTVQRDPDQGLTVDEAVPFGLAITLTMPGVVEIYEQVRQRLTIAARVET